MNPEPKAHDHPRADIFSGSTMKSGGHILSLSLSSSSSSSSYCSTPPDDRERLKAPEIPLK